MEELKNFCSFTVIWTIEHLYELDISHEHLHWLIKMFALVKNVNNLSNQFIIIDLKMCIQSIIQIDCIAR